MKNIKHLHSLRAAGLFLVLAYHLFPDVFRGGFIGVDIFFVCSGYLAAAALAREYLGSGSFGLWGYLKKRARRLMPSVFIMILAVLSLSLTISPDFRVNVGIQAAAAAAGLTNFYEIAAGASYENRLFPHFFLHTWTLSVELQFCLIWGAASTLVLRAGKNAGKKTALFGLFTAAVLFSATSYALMRYYLPDPYSWSDPARAYFATGSRLYPLTIGAAAGIITGAVTPKFLSALARKPRFRIFACVFATLSAVFFLTAAFFMSYNEPAVYEYGILAVALASAALAATFTLLTETEQKPEPAAFIEYLSTRSYGIYLYHWPFYIIIKQFVRQNVAAAALTLLFTAAAAEISYRFVETRFRAKKPAQGESEPKRFGALIKAACVAVTAAMFMISGYSAYSAPKKTSVELDLEFQEMYIAQNARSETEQSDENEPEDGAPTYTEPYETDEKIITDARPADENDIKIVVSDVEMNSEAEPAFTVEIATGPYVLTSPAPFDLDPFLNDAASGSALSLGPDESDDETDVDNGDENDEGPPVSMPDTVVMIGDSSMLGAANAIIDTIPNSVVDALVSRDLKAGLALLEEYEESGELSEVFVIALASNNINKLTRDRIVEIIERFGPGRKIVFVTGYGNSNMKPVAEFIRTLPETYGNVAVADWEAGISEHTEWLYGDNVHVKDYAGKQLYADLIADAIDRLIYPDDARNGVTPESDSP